MARKRTITQNVPIGQRIAQGIEGAAKGIEFTEALKSAQVKRDQMREQSALLEQERQMRQEQFKMAAGVGLKKIQADVMQSDDMNAALELAYPRLQELYEAQGIQAPPLKQMGKRLKALGSTYQENLSSATDMYKYMQNYDRLTPEQRQATGDKVIGALQNLSQNSLLPKEERQLYRDELAKFNDFAVKKQESEAAFAQRRTLQADALRSEERIAQTKAGAAKPKKGAEVYNPEKVANIDRAMSLLSQVSTGPIVGSAPIGKVRKALGDQKFEFLETTLNNIGLDKIAAFASEAGARSIDSDSERAFLQSVLPGVNKTQDTNLALLLVAKGQEKQKQLLAQGVELEGTAKFYNPKTNDVIIAKPNEVPNGYVSVLSLYEPKKEEGKINMNEANKAQIQPGSSLKTKSGFEIKFK